MEKKMVLLIISIFIILFSSNVYAKNVCFQDKNLESALEEKLSIKFNDDCADIKNIEGITSLTLNGYEIKNIDGLSSFINLEYLNINNNVISNLNEFKNLTKLKYLDLSHNDIKRINDLKSLNNLTYLNLYDNKIIDVDGIGSLTNLVYLSLGDNNENDKSKIRNIEEINNLVNLKHFDFSRNNDSEIKNNITNLKNLEYLNLLGNGITDFDLESYSNLKEIYYKNITYSQISVTPHIDSDGVKYVNYEDFGAKSDGVHDDFLAIKEAHDYANRNNVEVRLSENKTYHIFNYYGDSAYINTNTDFNNCTFIIHDEDIENYLGRFNHLFSVTTNYNDIKNIDNPNIKLDNKNKKLIGFNDLVKDLNYQKYEVVLENNEKKRFIRYGINSNSGDNETDLFIVDKLGNILSDITWDIDNISNIRIFPVSDKKLTIKNGNFITNSSNDSHNLVYERSGKPKYYERNIYLWGASNVSLENINHSVSLDNLSYAYNGFISMKYSNNISVDSAKLYAHKFKYNARSTYDLKLDRSINLNFNNIVSDNIYDSNRWGIMASEYTKDVSFNNATLNRIDAHQGVHNLTINNSNIGYYGLTLNGFGDLNVNNTTVTSENFISLRGDYGSSWNGDFHINNSTHKWNGRGTFKLLGYDVSLDGDKLHDFGYKTYLPNIYLNNFTIDSNNKNLENYYLIPNVSNMNKLDYDYFPKEVVIDNYKSIGNIKINTNNNIRTKFIIKEKNKEENNKDIINNNTDNKKNTENNKNIRKDNKNKTNTISKTDVNVPDTYSEKEKVLKSISKINYIYVPLLSIISILLLIKIKKHWI